MQRNFTKSIFATVIVVFLALNASLASAEKKDSKPDVTTICYNVATVCQDACDKAALTGSEYAKCNRGCDDSLSACLPKASRGGRGGAATPKDLHLKKETKKYLPSN